MAIYLRQFDTHADYEAAESNLILPNVSVCVDQPTVVHYNPIAPPSYDYVELAGIKWATKNVGANSVTDYGLYFQWGDTQGYTASQVGSGEGQKYFGWTDYKYCDGTSSVMTKYNESDGLTTLQSTDDAVTAAWGGNWRMPTASELQTLVDAVDGGSVMSAWTNDYQGSGVSGVTFTDVNDSSNVLFFPAAGYCDYGNVSSVGNYGYYWSSTNDTNCGGNMAHRIQLYNDYIDFNASDRYFGYSIRGILDE